MLFNVTFILNNEFLSELWANVIDSEDKTLNSCGSFLLVCLQCL